MVNTDNRADSATTINTDGIRYWAVVPAAGIGTRMGAERPKQYLLLNGKAIVEHTLERLLSLPWLEGVVVAINPADQYWDKLAIARHPQVHRVDGGDERCESVLNGLRYLHNKLHADLDARVGNNVHHNSSNQPSGAPNNRDWVLVHDAARPCVTREQIECLAAELQQHSVGGILGVPVSDTLKRVNQEYEIDATVDRQLLWQAQTPQMFRYGILCEALQRGIDQGQTITDDASAVEQLGYRPLMIEGRRDNIKITRPEDLPMAELILRQQLA